MITSEMYYRYSECCVLLLVFWGYFYVCGTLFGKPGSRFWNKDLWIWSELNTPVSGYRLQGLWYFVLCYAMRSYLQMTLIKFHIFSKPFPNLNSEIPYPNFTAKYNFYCNSKCQGWEIPFSHIIAILVLIWFPPFLVLSSIIFDNIQFYQTWIPNSIPKLFGKIDILWQENSNIC